jgi:hypothetical protein
MKKLLIGAAALAIGLAPAGAQPAPPPPPGVAQGTAPAAPLPPARHMHSRVMSDKVMTRDEAVNHVRKMFARFDTNRDGVVTREEADALHQKMVGSVAAAGDMQSRLAGPGIMKGDRNAVFDRLDTNHDGTISRQEFTSAQPQAMILRNGSPPGMQGMEQMKMHMRGAGMGRGFGGHLFEMADANRDGRLTLQEAEAAALAHFDKADLNHDGKITPEERAQRHSMKRSRSAS